MKKRTKGRIWRVPAKRRRSPEWEEVYVNFVVASVAYARHPETPDAVAAPLLGALAELRRRLNGEDWIPKELDLPDAA